ncbi:putative carboxylesterase [Aspergillus pseudoustus]|uniref:Carboxylic ester hydrolase n=1 Tax=Aspergillus pseudoustus TaxID=1810923 RepID=A0ABR4KYF6_9EURO
MPLVNHPSLGSVRGTLDNGVEAYLGIQYATLSHPFAAAVPVEIHRHTADDFLDATSYGPTVPGPDGCDAELALIQHDLPRQHAQQSMTDGLTLNILRTQKEFSSLLPVLVFLHGGGLAVGSATWSQNRLSKLISVSGEQDLPTVGVSVNYRVGPAGFLTSEEMRNAGFPPNNGLKDQRAALEWVKDHIAGFGGDPDNITLVGHSAGAACATYHLASHKPLFNRIVCLSGTFLAVRTLPSPVHEALYAQSIRILGLEQMSTEERIRRLQKISSTDLARIAVVLSRPITDDDVCLMTPSFEGIQDGIPTSLHPLWCKDILIGDCQFDGSILASAFDGHTNDISRRFRAFLTDQLADVPDAASRLLAAYRFTADDDAALKQILKLANDIVFYAPTVAIARAWQHGAAYVYRFDQGNPWEGRWQGEASHITDLAMLTQNFNEVLPDEHREVAKMYARDLLTFASGQPPWEAFKPGPSPFSKTYGGSLSGEGRRELIWGFMDEIGADRLAALIDGFIATTTSP